MVSICLRPLKWQLICRGKNNQSKVACDGTGWGNESDTHPFGVVTDAGDLNDASGSSKAAESESETGSVFSNDQLKCLMQHMVQKVWFVIICSSYVYDIIYLEFATQRHAIKQRGLDHLNSESVFASNLTQNDIFLLSDGLFYLNKI